MSGYTKLFTSILASSIWSEDDKTRLVWITMLAMADPHGIVEASALGLAHAAHVTVQECEAALEKLRSPDRYSRTKDHDGRRIEDVDGGYRLLNYTKYREKMSAEDRREYQRQYRSKYRAEGRDKAREANKPVNTGQQSSASGQSGSTGSIQAEAEADLPVLSESRVSHSGASIREAKKRKAPAANTKAVASPGDAKAAFQAIKDAVYEA